MINRLFARPNSSLSYLTRRNPVRPFNFALKQQLAFVADLEAQLQELELRFASNSCPPPIPQQRIDAAAYEPEDVNEPCTYDDFGLVEGLDLDVSWM